MPRIKEEDRKRAKRPKTRSGCKTCKIRRIKCDEERPHCKRCVSTGRTCDGYDEPFSVKNGALSKAPSCALPSIFASEKEHRSFAFFLERTRHQLSGYYECEFWDKVILQAAQVDPGIRCSIIALGSLHEAYEKFGEAATTGDDFALQQYNVAIRQHLDSLADPDKDIAKIDSYVASCMVFTCIELIQGHYLSAVSLIKGAVSLFYERTLHHSSDSAWPVEVFELILSRLQSQAIGLVDPAVVGPTVPPRLRPAVSVWIPEQFESVSEAKSYLEFYAHSYSLSKPPKTTLHEPRTQNYDYYRYILTHWNMAFERMLAADGDRLSKRDWRAANTLKMWSMLQAVSLKLRLEHPFAHDDLELWDLYTEDYAEIARLAETVIEAPTEGEGGKKYQITLEFGVVGVMYDAARTCRDPIIRRKFIHLLQVYACKEGLWDSLLAAASAQRQMELEEAAVSEVRVAGDIPGWARIRNAMPTFQPGQQWVSVLYTRQRPPDGSEPESFHEVIKW